MNVDKCIRKKCLPRNALSACFSRSCIKFASLNWADIWIKKEDYKDMVQIYWAAYLFFVPSWCTLQYNLHSNKISASH